MRRLFMIGRSLLAAALLFAAGGSSIAQSLQGVNLAGAGFAPDKIPGVYGYDFEFPNRSEVEYFSRKGMNVFRVSIQWERLQPALYGPFDPDELARLQKLVAEIHQNGGSVIIDVHNYGAYRGVEIGQNPVTFSAFVDLWSKLATLFGHDDYVLFGLMNEPQLEVRNIWKRAVQHVIVGIRATGATNQILVSGTEWDSAQHFAKISGSLSDLEDPQQRLVFEVHEYFDDNASGSDDTCVDPDEAIARLAPFTDWLRAQNRLGFLGEFGVSRRPECLAVLDRVVSYLKANSDVWLGWTYWAAGPRWGEYMFTIEPVAGQDRPQMVVLEKYLHPAAVSK